MKGMFGGAKGDRAADLLHAMQALSQLSYSPKKLMGNFKDRFKYVNKQYKSIAYCLHILVVF